MEQQEIQLKKLGFKKKDSLHDEVDGQDENVFVAVKDKLLMYLAEPKESLYVVLVANEEESVLLEQFHTIDQFLTSFKKGKLVF